MTDSPALLLRGLKESYGDVQALRGVDLEVRRGEDLRLFWDPTGRARPPPSAACST